MVEKTSEEKTSLILVIHIGTSICIYNCQQSQLSICIDELVHAIWVNFQHNKLYLHINLESTWFWELANSNTFISGLSKASLLI